MEVQWEWVMEGGDLRLNTSPTQPVSLPGLEMIHRFQVFRTLDLRIKVIHIFLPGFRFSYNNKNIQFCAEMWYQGETCDRGKTFSKYC
jgi:hypothetical protein